MCRRHCCDTSGTAPARSRRVRTEWESRSSCISRLYRRDPGFGAHIRKCAVAIVVIQAARLLLEAAGSAQSGNPEVVAYPGFTAEIPALALTSVNVPSPLL